MSSKESGRPQPRMTVETVELLRRDMGNGEPVPYTTMLSALSPDNSLLRHSGGAITKALRTRAHHDIQDSSQLLNHQLSSDELKAMAHEARAIRDEHGGSHDAAFGASARYREITTDHYSEAGRKLAASWQETVAPQGEAAAIDPENVAASRTGTHHLG